MKDSIPASPVTDFTRAIAPVTPQVFFDEYFEKRHLVIRREDRDYYRDLLSLADIDQVLTSVMLSTEEVQMVNTGQPVPVADYAQASGWIDPARVAQQFEAGATIILPALHRMLPRLTAYCRALETVFSCDLQTNIYFTPAEAQGFKTHYDSHDVIVLQCHGSKLWRIYDSPLELPLGSQAFKPEGFTPGAVIDEFVLNAGDLLYCPRGVVHDARATDEMSLHITTGLLTPRWVDLVVEAVSQLALTDPALRRAVPPGFANDGFDRTQARQTFRDLLTRAAQAIDPDAVLDGFAAEFRDRRVPVLPGQFLQHVASDGVAVGTRVALRPHLISAIARQDDTVVLSVYGTDISFPAHAEGALRAALKGPGFVVGELDCDLDEDGQAVLARRLVREGVLYQPV